MLVLLNGTECAAQTNAATNSTDLSAVALMERVQKASQAANTMSADFTYLVTSVKQQQMVVGKMRLMKPNFARLTFSYIAVPSFANLVASDGTNLYTFRLSGFQASKPFAREGFDPWRAAQYASGAQAGGGTYSTTPADPEGLNIHLWDGVPLQAFYDPEYALHQYLYLQHLDELELAEDQEIDGVTYKVLHHHVENGNIAGGEASAFEQHLYIGPDDLIHMYTLEFTSGGRPGLQIMRLRNIKLNVPMTTNSFAFTPPGNPPPVQPEAVPGAPR
jgi:outer membrane lipoprotein-sorting protein